ncbi:hypothetical protein PL81_31120 [Streptomyces sp. RSD-27]|nr:hypothetical protein PL81_31120 [Streptomyces sp. RSD-27]
MTDEPNLRARALDAAAQALNAGGYWLPTDGQAAIVDAVLAVADAEIDTARRRPSRSEGQLAHARLWARTNLTAEQQHQLLSILGGRA